jgi:hypothetical protein
VPTTLDYIICLLICTSSTPKARGGKTLMLADCQFGCGSSLDYVAQINNQPTNIDICNKILANSLEQFTNIHKHKITFENK